MHTALAPITQKSSTTTTTATATTASTTPTTTTTLSAAPAVAVPSATTAAAAESVRLEEISPGVFMRYIGTEAATWQGILNGQVILLECLCCTTELHVLDSVQFVLCPSCGVTGPVGEQAEPHPHYNDDDDDKQQQQQQQHELPAIGIGFTTEAIMAMLQ
jgi:hypothetical protein